jgi:NTP pyrophosphatase (non-canonical NTP hydrolase)
MPNDSESTERAAGGVPMTAPPARGWTLGDLQRHIHRLYGPKDEARGDAATFLWLTEEFGELATALRSGSDEELALEMADVLAWLVTLANVRGIDLDAAISTKYGACCPGCRAVPCVCDPAQKP